MVTCYVYINHVDIVPMLCVDRGMEHAITSVEDLFSALGGPAEVGRIIGKGASTASEMKRRKSIPVPHWSFLIAAAAERQILGISFETLALMHGAKTPSDVAASMALEAHHE